MTNNEHFIFLEKLRRSGKTNMYEAAPYLMVEFGLMYEDAIRILINWMKNYDPKDYEGMNENG